ncbi:hypothetical protein KXR53_28420 [Inquilinus limosus]
MLVVIILLTAVVFGELGRRFLSAGSTSAPSAVAPATAPAATAAPSALPAGSRITSITAIGNRAVMLITLPGGGQELRSIDPRTGAATTLLTTAP